MPQAGEVSSDPVAAYLRARAVNETFKAKVSQLEYEERSRKLIPAARASEYAATFSAIVKDALLSMPDRLAPMLAAVDEEKAIHRLMAAEVAAVLKKINKAVSGFGSLMQPFLMSEIGAAMVLPPREITVSQWADENRVLTGAAAAERGQWRTRPYQREPMDVLSPSHPCKQVVLWSAAQLLKTECLLNFLGFIADVDPGPVLLVEPRTEDAKALSKDRVAPMFRNTPALRGRSRPSNRATPTTPRCTKKYSRTARGISRSPVLSRHPALPCGRSDMRCSMRWTVIRQVRVRKGILYRLRSSAPRSSPTTKRS